MRERDNLMQRLVAAVAAFAVVASLAPVRAIAYAMDDQDGGDAIVELADPQIVDDGEPAPSEGGGDDVEPQEVPGDSETGSADLEGGDAGGVESGEELPVADELADTSAEANPQRTPDKDDEPPADAGAGTTTPFATEIAAEDGDGPELTAQASAHTADEAVAWARARAEEHWEINDGSGWTQCTEFVWKYYEYLIGYHVGGNAYDYLGDSYGACPYGSGWTRPSPSDVRPGDIVIWDAWAVFRSDGTDYATGYGHIGVVVSVDGNSMVTVEANAGEPRGAAGYKYNREVSCISGLIRPAFSSAPDPGEWGEEMAAGYDRVLPDGDYIIALTSSVNSSPLWFLDIIGSDAVASNGANVNLWSADDGAEGLSARACDLWHIAYSGGFYTITQKGTGIALDVDGASRARGANVQAWAGNGSSAQKWAISNNGDGYRLQAKCSGFSLDNSGARLEGGNNIHVWQSNSTDAQRWSFIPVGSEMTSGYSRVLPDGDYIIALTSSVNSSPLWFLDIAGTDVPAANGANVNLWSADDGAEGLSARACDLWHIAYSGGFYTITQKGTGIALDVDSASRARGANVQAWAVNGSSAQKWAISNNGDGYRLQAKCSGFSLDNSGARLEGGNNIHVWQSNSTDAQRWSFIPVKASQAITASNKSVAMGKTVSLGAKTSGNGTLTYKSSNTKVATVSSKGVVTPKGVGKVTITITASATANYKAATKKVTVTVTKGTQTITASNKQVVTGKTASLGAKASGGGKLTYKSSDTKVATVDSKGTVKGVKAGTVKITITASANTNWNKTTKVVTVKVGKANPMTARAAKASVTVKYATVKTNAVVTARNVAVSKVQGTLAYTNASADVTAKKFSVNKKTGKVTVPKGTKKGTYVVKVKVTAAGNSSYIAGSKTVSYKVVVK